MNSTPHSLLLERRPLKAEGSDGYRVGGPNDFPMMFPDNFYYDHNGIRNVLNWKLAQYNKCSSDDMWNIILLHHHRIEVMDKFHCIWQPNQLQELVQELEDIEYDLQFFWHLPMDFNYHTFWSKVEGCTCVHSLIPRAETRIISKNCELHNSELYHG